MNGDILRGLLALPGMTSFAYTYSAYGAGFNKYAKPATSAARRALIPAFPSAAFIETP